MERSGSFGESSLRTLSSVREHGFNFCNFYYWPPVEFLLIATCQRARRAISQPVAAANLCFDKMRQRTYLHILPRNTIITSFKNNTLSRNTIITSLSSRQTQVDSPVSGKCRHSRLSPQVPYLSNVLHICHMYIGIY